MVDMPVIVRHHFRIEARCASITGMIRHYAAEGLVIWSLITGIMPR
jgi:hypothetical protein